MKNTLLYSIILLCFTFSTFNANAQLNGSFRICDVTGDPNSVTKIQDQAANECQMAYDSEACMLWFYDETVSPAVWVDFASKFDSGGGGCTNCYEVIDNGDGTTTITDGTTVNIVYNTNTTLVTLADNGDGTGAITDGTTTLDVCLAPCGIDGSLTNNTNGTVTITIDGVSATLCESPCNDGGGGVTETTWTGTSVDGAIIITAGGTNGHAPSFAIDLDVLAQLFVDDATSLTILQDAINTNLTPAEVCAAVAANCPPSGGTTVTITDNTDGTITLDNGTTSATLCEAPCFDVVVNNDGTTTITDGTITTNVYNTTTTLVTIADDGDGTGTITDGTTTLDLCLEPCGIDGSLTTNGDGTVTIVIDGNTATICESPCPDGGGGVTETTWTGTSANGSVIITAGGTNGHAPGFEVDESVVLTEIISNTTLMDALCDGIEANCTLGSTTTVTINNDGTVTVDDGTTSALVCEAPCGGDIPPIVATSSDTTVVVTVGGVDGHELDITINTEVVADSLVQNPTALQTLRDSIDTRLIPVCILLMDGTELPKLRELPSGDFYDVDGDTTYPLPTGAMATDGGCQVSSDCFQYAVTSTNLTAFVWATGNGVTLTEHGPGEMRFNIPAGVRIKQANVNYLATFTLQSSVYVQFAYADVLPYNTSVIDANAPIMRWDNAAVMGAGNRSNPNFSDSGGANSIAKYGISNIGAFLGGSTDLEMSVNDAPHNLSTEGTHMNIVFPIWQN